MDSKQQLYFLFMLKALADENRLAMTRMMANQERTVTEMAQITGLSEPTVSHHVSKLHTAGFLTLRMAGNQRFYMLKSEQLDALKTFITQLTEPMKDPETILSENAWIEALNWDEEDKKVLRDYTLNGQLTQLPSKEKRWLVVLRWLATKFEAGGYYTEKQVNAIITEAHPDYATIRRNLVEYGFMRRERGGGNYWLTPEDESIT
ncbi:MAG TPA: metalloregulator ArsR/SmtB family transcription factor [Aggregatilineales bacterium]|nr:metalloregulator ArsR/SmtB family transcription factor [Aggregatilineales bacterium]